MAVKKVNGITFASLSEPEFVDTPDWGPDYKGRVWEIDRSSDGRRSIALFEQSGVSDFEYPCDEVVYVLRGTLSCTFDDGQVVELTKGDVAFFEKGVKGHFVTSEDFSDLAIFLSDDKPINII
jgi:uncharacterized cupin superfamily protein